MARGIPPGSIEIAGRGERELLIPTRDKVHEPSNRRVEINVR
jgi:outer membrane protein OmpA-like peptidoglycan-associated protein